MVSLHKISPRLQIANLTDPKGFLSWRAFPVLMQPDFDLGPERVSQLLKGRSFADEMDQGGLAHTGVTKNENSDSVQSCHPEKCTYLPNAALFHSQPFQGSPRQRIQHYTIISTNGPQLIHHTTYHNASAFGGHLDRSSMQLNRMKSLDSMFDRVYCTFSK
jgi:hypothetical protein